jgi:quinol-cytochrome oxidoreductase complex cytochrome b subunit
MYPYFIFKDLVTIFAFLLVLSIMVFFYPNLLGHSDNYIPANPMVTPISIVPEWYLLPFYAILRSIPNKLLGVVAMFGSLFILLILPFVDFSRTRGNKTLNPINMFFFTVFVCNFLTLGLVGSNHATEPFILLGQVCTIIYFAYFLFIVPIMSILQNTFLDLATIYIKSA